MIGELWSLQSGTFRTSGPLSWWRAVRTLRQSLGVETDRLVAAAERGEPGLRRLEREWAERVAARLGVGIQPLGMHHIDPEEQYVVVALHEGFADVLVLLHLGLDLRFAARSELWKWPVLGEYLRAADHFVTDPERPIASLRTMLRSADQVFADGNSLAVFAQGTVLGIETGFHRGAFDVAVRTGHRVLPVVIAGTHRVWEHPFSSTLRFGCPVFVEVLEPVHVDDVDASLHSIQHRMKTRALHQLHAAPRRFDPDRDGIWPDHAYTIDPAFPAVMQRVAALKADTAEQATA